ncbi:APC family permease [Rhodococcus jostii]|uniref:APC family permease n=1 Tax=Rhodococcus jostii TaxID=132919 RepID=UPI003648D687
MTSPSNKRALVAARSPVQGLPRRQLSFIPVFAQSVAAVAPSGGAAVVPALVISTAGGGGALAAFVCAAVVILLVSACLRPMAQRMASVGGIYSYTARGLGPTAAVPTGWSAIVGYATVGMAGLLAVGTYLSHIAVTSGLARGTPTGAIVAVTVVAATVATLVMIRGIRISAWITLLVECVSIGLVGALLILLLVTSTSSGAPVAAAMSWDGNAQSMALSVVVAVSAFVGFESSTTLSGEARQPFLTVPRVIRWTPVAAGALYLIAVPVQAIALADTPEAVRESATPLVTLLVSEGSTGLSAILDLGIAASFFACTLASVNALVRVLFCMGREGVAPAGLGHTHPRFQTPAYAIAASMLVITAVPIVVLLAGVSPDQGLRMFLTLAACGYIGSYVTGCLSAPLLLRRIGESTPAVWVLGVLTTGILLFLVINAVIFAVTDGLVLIAVYAVIMAGAVLYTLTLRRLAPHRLESVGIYDETQRTDLLPTVPFR